MATITNGKSPAPPTVMQKKEDVLDVVGGDGPWQRRVFLVIIIISIPLAGHNFSMSFFAPNMDYWCARPATSNWTVKEWKIVGLPPNDKKCSRYKYINNSIDGYVISNHSKMAETLPCDAWEYDDEFYGPTLLREWNLVCDRDWLISLSKSIFIGGFLFSVLVFGYLSDKFGRKPFIALCNLIALVSAVIGAFSVSFLMFALSRFFVAVGVAGAYTIGFVLLMEIIGPEYRSFYGIVMNFGWCFGYVTLPGIVWLIKDWFWIQLVITIPCVIMLPSWWLIPESPRWLLTKGDDERALEMLLMAGKANKRSSPNLRSELKEIISKTEKVYATDDSIAKVLRQLWTSSLWKRTLVIFYLWFVNAFVYYGISYNTNELAGDPYVNFAISGALEIPAYVLIPFVIRALGRKNPLAISMSATGLSCFLIYVMPQDPWWSTIVVFMFGKFCITSSFSILYVVTVEVFPTTIRNISLGSASTIGRCGSIIAPFVRELGNATHPVVPQIIFGVIAIIGGLLTLCLPETNNQKVPDTMEEAVVISR